MLRSVRSHRQLWLLVGNLTVCGALIALAAPVAGNSFGTWKSSNNPLYGCDVVGEPDKVCAEWLTGNEPSYYQPCCIDSSALDTHDFHACEDPQPAGRPAEF
ncbi:MAG: hypothetical protein AAF657_10345 [Acidobacteriota bacterium]